MSIRSKFAVCAVMIAIAAPAAAQQEGTTRARGQGWGVLSHQTVGGGATAVNLQLGFPGLSLGVLHGLQPGFDLGARFALNYAHEGLVRALYPGLKFEVLGRLKLFEGERVGLGLNFGMGMSATFGANFPTTNVLGISFPIGLVAGFPIGSALVANFGLDMPLLVVLGTGAGLSVPVLGGVGLEYFIDKGMIITFATRMGPTINPIVRISDAEFAFQAQLGVALKL